MGGEERVGEVVKVLGSLCAGCVCEETGQRFIPPDGLGTNRVLILGDSPWKDEVIKGVPFAGYSGRFLERCFRSLGVTRESFIVTNAMSCKPVSLGWSDNPYNPEAAMALAQCAPYLDETIERMKPKVIVALGGAAMRRMIGTNQITEHHCYVEPTAYGIPCIPTFHPSFLMRPGNSKLTISLVCALKKALGIAAGTELIDQDELIVDPPVEEFRAYLQRGLINGRYPWLMGDIETAHSEGVEGVEREDRAYDTRGEMGPSYHIHRVGLGYKKNSAVTVPWCPPYIQVVKDHLKLADLFIQHTDNRYDSRRLIANGCEIGKVASSMWAWHFYHSELLMRLEFCAPFFFNGPTWKHMGSIDPIYNAKDVCRQIGVWLGCQQGLEKESRWSAFLRDCVDYDPALWMMGQAGCRIDVPAKELYISQMRSEADKLQEQFLSDAPASAKKLIVKHRLPKNNPELYRTETRVKQLKKGPKEYTVWVREELNTRSHTQVKELIRQLGHKVPTKRGKEGERVETSGAKQLGRLAKKTPFLRQVLLIRKRETMVSNYDWIPDFDGRIRSFYGYSPTTWRTNSFHQNLQVIPRRNELALEFRKCIIAAPGCVLGEVDSEGIEAVLVGYFAQSERYIRLAKAGVHGWLTAAKLGIIIPLDLPFDELRRRCKEYKKLHPKLYDVCKPIIHGGNFMEEAYGVYEQNPENFDSEKEAGDLLKLYFSLEPGQDVKKWQHDVLRQVGSKQGGALLNPYGYKGYFFNIFRWDGGDYALDKQGDGKAAVAFLPQSTASGHQRETVRIIKEKYPSILPMLRLPRHDSLGLEYPESLGDDPIRVLAGVMSSAREALGGLSISAEAVIGNNLGEMETVNL